jgi:hypothetical protein
MHTVDEILSAPARRCRALEQAEGRLRPTATWVRAVCRRVVLAAHAGPRLDVR